MILSYYKINVYNIFCGLACILQELNQISSYMEVLIMKKQMSQVGLGMILTLLLILGLSYKGSYGKVSVKFRNLPQLVEEVISSNHKGMNFHVSAQINSMFIRSHKGGSPAMIILVAYDDEIVETVQRELQTPKIALLLSASTLPSYEVNLDPSFIQFEQDHRTWHPHSKSNNDYFALFSRTKFGGIIHEGEIHQGIVMLPEWFDLHRPITIHYLDSSRVFSFK